LGFYNRSESVYVIQLSHRLCRWGRCESGSKLHSIEKPSPYYLIFESNDKQTGMKKSTSALPCYKRELKIKKWGDLESQ
jgi:hypothetical protein